MEEKEIDLIDLIADILAHWRGMLICMLAGAVLLGAFSYVRSYRNVKEAKKESDEYASQNGSLPLEELLYDEKVSSKVRLKELEELLTDSEKAAVFMLIDDEQEQEIYRQYVEQSILMHMDPYNMPRMDLLFSIQVEDMGQGNMLRTVYEELINGVGMFQYVEEQTGISGVSAAELIGAQARSNVLVLNGAQETDFGNDYLKVIIYHSDEAECRKLAQCVKDYIVQQQECLTQELGAHNVVLLSEAAGRVMDTGVRDRQISYSNTDLSLQMSCANTKAALSKAQQSYYDLLTGGTGVLEKEPEVEEDLQATDKQQSAESQPEEPIGSPSVSVKMAVVGALLFVFVYAGIFFLRYVLNNKLRAVDELQKLYHIAQLGLIVKDEDKKKIFIDRWIDALRNRNKRRFTREQSLELAAAAVKMSLYRRGENSVCLMGCDLEAGADAASRALKEMLEKENIAVAILNNVIYDAEEMEKLKDVKSIVLVEKAMSTLYDEILRELELISRQNIMTLGGIIVE